MQIADFTFRPINGIPLYPGPGVYMYIHQTSGKCFVRAMRNVRMQKSNKNYPAPLKALLKTHPSEVLLYLAELPKDTKEVLYLASRAVATHLSGKGLLYKKPKPSRGGMYRILPGEESDGYTVWRMLHKKTGAVFYFEELKGICVKNKISQRMLTFNNYVMKNIPNTNRAMYHFAKQHFPLDVEQWDVQDLALTFSTEREAMAHITKLSKQHLEKAEPVLNRIASFDPLYYRNTMLKLTPHLGMGEYLVFKG